MTTATKTNGEFTIKETTTKVTTTAKPSARAVNKAKTVTTTQTNDSAAKVVENKSNTKKKKRFHLKTFLESSGYTVLCASIGLIFGSTYFVGLSLQHEKLMFVGEWGLIVTVLFLVLPSPIYQICGRIKESFMDSIY